MKENIIKIENTYYEIITLTGGIPFPCLFCSLRGKEGKFSFCQTLCKNVITSREILTSSPAKYYYKEVPIVMIMLQEVLT